LVSRCVWCNSLSAERVLERRDRLGEHMFDYFRCCQCGLIRLYPGVSLAEKDAYYPPTYEAYREQRGHWLARLGQRWYWSRRVHAVHRFRPPPGNVLDVGCATGGYLVMMQARGWQVSGIEPNLEAAARARQRLGPQAVCRKHLEEAQYPADTFDLITLWDVLDHVQNPLEALRKVKIWLRSEGLLVVGVPDPGSWDARVFGDAWLGWDAPRHLYVFPERTLLAILEEIGFQAIATGCWYGSYGSLVASLEYVLQERLAPSNLRRLLRRVIALRVWRYLCWPYFRLAEWAGRGPIKTYVCRPIMRGGELR
jgi:SAM-dependent methyltransferase